MLAAILKTIFRPLVILSERLHLLVRNSVWRLRLGDVGRGTNIYPRVAIYAGRSVRIGARVTINDFVHIRGRGGVHIGDDTMIAPHVTITSETHDIAASRRGKDFRETSELGPVRIGRNVWVGAGVIILPNVEIGDGAMIAAGSVVTRNVPANTLVAGTPARALRHLD